MLARIANEVNKASNSKSSQEGGAAATPVVPPAVQETPPSREASIPATPRIRKQPTTDEDDNMGSANATPTMPSKLRKAQTLSLQSLQDPIEKSQKPPVALVTRAPCS